MDGSHLQKADSTFMRSTISSELYRLCRKIVEIASNIKQALEKEKECTFEGILSSLDASAATLCWSTSSSGNYLQSKQIAEQNSNREQEALPEKEKEEATKGLFYRRSTVVRKYLLLMVTFMASTCYLAGVSPPGGFWSDNGGTRLAAGDPMHSGTYPSSCKAFFFNSIAFIISIFVLYALIWHDANKDTVKHSRNQPIVPKLAVDVPRFCSQSDPAAKEDGPNRAIMQNSPKDIWYVDCGVTHHATGNQSLLLDVDDGNGKDIFLRRANGEVLQVSGRGSVRTESIALDDVWYAPGLDSNLVSTGQLARQGCAITLGPDGCRITRGGTLVGSARFTDSDQFELDFLEVASSK